MDHHHNGRLFRPYSILCCSRVLRSRASSTPSQEDQTRDEELGDPRRNGRGRDRLQSIRDQIPVQTIQDVRVGAYPGLDDSLSHLDIWYVARHGTDRSEDISADVLNTGLVYLLFEALPISFAEERHYNLGVSSLPFLAILVGIILGGCFTTWITATRFARIMRETGRLEPEERLIPMVVGGLLLPIGMFWFAWTSSPHITPWPSIIALVPVGAGIQIVFQQVIIYLVDCYLWQANSAIAVNTIVRSLAAAGFVEFATGMYHQLGVAWASSLLAFLCLAMVPVPVLFYIYGARIRKMSRYSPFRAT